MKAKKQQHPAQGAINDMEHLLIGLCKRGEYFKAVYVFQAMDMLCDKFKDYGVEMPEDAVAMNIFLDEKLKCNNLSL
jgi:pentatricopeptide repeat protein